MHRSLTGLWLACAILLGILRPAAAEPLDPGLPSREQRLKDRLLVRAGGNAKSEAAVAAGLKWLASHQAADGHWGMHDFHLHGKCNCTGAGGKFDVAGTAFGLLPFLGAGYLHKGPNHDNPYAKAIGRGLTYLVDKQDHDGRFGPVTMAEHALATQAICLAYHLSGDPRLKESAQRAVRFILDAQGPRGGWRYQPRAEQPDTEQTGWQMQALRMAQVSGLDVPRRTFTRAGAWLDEAACDDDGSTYAYVMGPASPSMTAVGLLCRQYLGWRPSYPGMRKGVDVLLQRPPSADFKDLFYYYHATQVMHHVGGSAWATWNPKMRDLLIAAQDKGSDPRHAHQIGSWSAQGDRLGGPMGRLGQTSLALLILEIYYSADAPLEDRLATARAAAELPVLWDALKAKRAVTARQSMWAMADSPSETIAYLADRLQPVKTKFSPQRLAQLMKDLDDDRFLVRRQASAELEKLADLAVPGLRNGLTHPSLEVRARTEQLLQTAERLNTSPDRMRASRAILTLETIGSAEARQLLNTLADGTPEAWLTLEARAALERLGKK